MDAHADVFQALADPTRLRLLNLVRRTGAICVCELVDALGVPQYSISRHLQILKSGGLVEDRRSGKWVYYSLVKGLKPYHQALLEAVAKLSKERGDFRADEARARERLKLRRGGVCCVGVVSGIAATEVRPRAGVNVGRASARRQSARRPGRGPIEVR